MRNLLVGAVIILLLVVGYIILNKYGESVPATGQNGTDIENQISEIGLDQIKSAPEKFASAQEALNAAKQAVERYDLEFIESFTLPVNCSWCSEFYANIKNILLTEETSSEAKNFYAELLAVSGDPANLDFLLEYYRNAKSDNDKEAIRNGLELIVANDEVLNWLYENFNNQQDPTLRDSILAAITNQDSTRSIEILYEFLTKSDNPEADAQKGLGLSEAVPPDEALNFLVDKFNSADDMRKKYIAAAILNNGLEGVKRFLDILSNDQGNSIIQHFDALADHVVFDQEIEAYLNDVSNKGNDNQKLFAKKVLDAFNTLRTELEDEGENSESEGE